MTQEQFGVSLGLTRDAVTYWLKQDDMTLSRLYYVAFVTDSDLRISITPQKEFETRGMCVALYWILFIIKRSVFEFWIIDIIHYFCN